MAPKKKYAPNSVRKSNTHKKRAVVLEPKEKRQRKFLQSLHSIRRERDTKKKESMKRRWDNWEREILRADATHAELSRENKKRRFALDGAQKKIEMERCTGGDE